MAKKKGDKAAAKTGTKKTAKNGKSPKAAVQTAARPSEVRKMIPASALIPLLRTCKSLRTDMQEISGDLGKAVSEAAERYGVNRKALSIVRTLDRMEPEKLAEVLDQLEYMLDVSGIQERANKVQRLPLGDTESTGKPTGGKGDKPFKQLGEVGDKIVKDIAAKAAATGDGEPASTSTH